MRVCRLRPLVITCATSVLAAAISACGSSHSSTAADAATSPAAVPSAPHTTTAPAAPPPAPRLRIVSPRPEARVAPTLTIRVSLTGAAATGVKALRYVLDGSLTRLGSVRLTFHGLAPGDHHLVVALASRAATNARVSFIVPAPVVPAPVAPTPAPTQTSSAPPPPASTPPPATSTTPAPAPTPSGGIPQGPNAGDADGDNHGGPSDGDGNL